MALGMAAPCTVGAENAKANANVNAKPTNYCPWFIDDAAPKK